MDKFWYLMGAIDFVAYNVHSAFPSPSLEAFEVRYRTIVGPFTGSHAVEKSEWKSYYAGWQESVIVRHEGKKVDYPY